MKKSERSAPTDSRLAASCNLRRAVYHDAALRQGADPAFRSIHGHYALNVLLDQDMALHLWQQAVQRPPKVAQYLVRVVKPLIAKGRPDLAKTQIDQLRRLGRLGQNEASARELDRLAIGPSRDREASDEVSRK